MQESTIEQSHGVHIIHLQRNRIQPYDAKELELSLFQRYTMYGRSKIVGFLFLLLSFVYHFLRGYSLAIEQDSKLAITLSSSSLSYTKDAYFQTQAELTCDVAKSIRMIYVRRLGSIPIRLSRASTSFQLKSQFFLL